MSGTIFAELKKKENDKKKEKLKTFMALLVSNIMVALLMSFLNDKNPDLVSPPPIKKILHPHYRIITLPITSLVEPDDKLAEIPITLVDKENKVLIEKAYLHEQLKKSDAFTEGRFRIEISENDILKIKATDDLKMIAVPLVKIEKTIPKLKQVSKYEVNL